MNRLSINLIVFYFNNVFLIHFSAIRQKRVHNITIYVYFFRYLRIKSLNINIKIFRKKL